MDIYISNINYHTSSESLGELFAQYGEVNSTRIITDRETGRSRGFGFVEMPNENEGNAAIEALDQQEFEGMKLNVSVARPRENRRSGGFNNGGGRRGGFGGGRRY